MYEKEHRAIMREYEERMAKQMPTGFRPHLLLVCPHCVPARRLVVTGETASTIAVGHEMPACPQYEAMDAADYLASCRKLMAG